MMAKSFLELEAFSIMKLDLEACLPNGLFIDSELFAATLYEKIETTERLGETLAVVRICAAKPSNSALPQLLFRLSHAETRACRILADEYDLLLWGSAATHIQSFITELAQQANAVDLVVRIGVAQCPIDARTPVTLRALACSRARDNQSSSLADENAILLEPELLRLYETAKLVAAGTISVFISGETGSGKEVLARSIHRYSPRAKQPFLGLNCAALTESLLESELFGHEKGAFTGAVQAKAGLLESADGGTVFLDELGEMPAALQAKLLRVLEEKCVTRVGGLRPRPIDVRFVSATHRNLSAEVQRGQFRSDLYYRLNGMTLSIPPLRERPAEIEPLAYSFCEAAARDAGSPRAPKFSYAALERLLEHTWPGNIRELRNVVERAVLLCRSEIIEPQHLGIEDAAVPVRPRSEPPISGVQQLSNAELEEVTGGGAPMRQSLSGEERSRLVNALGHCGGNQTQAARLLGISRGTLISRIAQYGLPRPRKREL